MRKSAACCIETRIGHEGPRAATQLLTLVPQTTCQGQRHQPQVRCSRTCASVCFTHILTLRPRRALRRVSPHFQAVYGNRGSEPSGLPSSARRRGAGPAGPCAPPLGAGPTSSVKTQTGAGLQGEKAESHAGKVRPSGARQVREQIQSHREPAVPSSKALRTPVPHFHSCQEGPTCPRQGRGAGRGLCGPKHSPGCGGPSPAFPSDLT